MAITVYTGVPGAGKSYAIIEQQVVPAVLAGRRVLTNVDGVDPAKIVSYCEAHKDRKGEVGSVVTFDGKDAMADGFWPTEDKEGFVQGGDLVVFDEWRLYFPKRGKLPTEDLEKFLRYHRHLTDEDGVACDVVIATQIPGDVHVDFRPLVERSFKFRKLKAVGLNTRFAWTAYEGHLQNADTKYRDGNGKYDPKIFPLYSSYTGGADGVEKDGDKRATMWGKHILVIVVVFVVFGAFAIYNLIGFFSGESLSSDPEQAASGPSARQQQQFVPVTAAWRIVGHFRGDSGLKVVVSHSNGSMRVLPGSDFTFEAGRPVRGIVDGQTVIAQDVLQEREQTGISPLSQVRAQQ